MASSIPLLKRLFLSRDIQHRLNNNYALKNTYLKYSQHNKKLILKKAISETRFVIFDTETTGLHAYAGDEIISIAMIEYRGLEPTGKIFESFIDPQRPIPAESTKIHGITDKDVKSAPVLTALLPDILDFMGNAVLVGHHVQFDFRFINKTLNPFLGLKLSNPWLDTMLLFLAHHGQLGHYQLEEVAQACHINIHNRHSAMGDTRTTAEIFNYLSKQLCKDSEPVINLINQQLTDTPVQP